MKVFDYEFNMGKEVEKIFRMTSLSDVNVRKPDIENRDNEVQMTIHGNISPQVANVTQIIGLPNPSRIKELQRVGYLTLLDRGFSPAELIMLGRYGEDMILPNLINQPSDRNFSRELKIVCDADTQQARAALYGLSDMLSETLSCAGLVPVLKLIYQGTNTEKAKPMWFPLLVRGRQNHREIRNIFDLGPNNSFSPTNSSHLIWAALFNYIQFCRHGGVPNPCSRQAIMAVSGSHPIEQSKVYNSIKTAFMSKNHKGFSHYCLGVQPGTVNRELAMIGLPSVKPHRPTEFVTLWNANDVHDNPLFGESGAIGNALTYLNDVFGHPNKDSSYMPKDNEAMSAFCPISSFYGVVGSMLRFDISNSILRTNTTERKTISIDPSNLSRKVSIKWPNSSLDDSPVIDPSTSRFRYLVKEEVLVSSAFYADHLYQAPNRHIYAAGPLDLTKVCHKLKSAGLGMADTIAAAVQLVESYLDHPVHKNIMGVRSYLA